ncbi:MAG: hypothetical protein ACK4OM_04555 [Alphaproteobacteria bacterium]
MLNETLLIGETDNESYIISNSNYCRYYFDDPALPDNTFQDFWTHIELGAGNYGLDGHTKISQNMTVLMELKFVSDIPNFIDSLQEHPENNYDPTYQYAVLFNTLDQLVYRNGARGIFHVNDLYNEYSEYAAEQLKQYASFKGYDEIIIEAVPGDYTKIIPYQTLEKYNKFLYDSVHLKNPEISFYNYGMDGGEMLFNTESRENARAKLQTLANLSYNGMYFFPIDSQDVFIPKAEKEEFINQGIFYHTTDKYAPVPYYFPEGNIFPEQYGSVYWISPNYTCY